MNQWACVVGKWLLLAVPPSVAIDTPRQESLPVDTSSVAAATEKAARESAPSKAVASDASTDPGLSPAELRELEGIRRRVGGNPLRGTLLDRVQLPELPHGAGEDFSKLLRSDYATETAAKSLHQRSVTDVKSAGPLTPEAAAYRRRSLRSLDRRLASIAIDLEELDCPDEAQRIRDLQGSLRRE